MMEMPSSGQTPTGDLFQELDALETAIASAGYEERTALKTRYLATLRLAIREGLDRGETQQAEAKSLHAITLFPDDEDAYEALISLYMESGRAPEAIRTLERRQNLPVLLQAHAPPEMPSGSSARSMQRFPVRRWAAPLAVLLAAGAGVTAVKIQHRVPPAPVGSKQEAVSKSTQAGRALEQEITAYNDRADYREAERLCNLALTLYHQDGNRSGVAEASARKGQVREAQGDRAGARRCYQEALSIRRERNEALAVAHLLEMLSGISQSDGDYAGADRLLQESQMLRQQGKEIVGVALCLRDRGILAADQGRYETAAANYRECLRIVAPLNKPEIEAHVHALQGIAARDQGALRQARSLLTGSLAFWQARNHPRWIAGMKRELGITAFYEKRNKEAEALLAESIRGYAGVGDRSGLAGTQVWMARVMMQQGRGSEAAALLQAAQTSPMEQQSLLFRARLQEASAEVLAKSDPREASAQLARASAQRRKMNCPLPPAERRRFSTLANSLH
jgi:tetratricopeptide (TPR) repeat protein